MYVNPDFKTKKALKEAVKCGDKMVTIFQPGGIFNGNEPRDGVVAVEGPHFPKPHSWYAQVIMEDGRVVKVK